MSGGFFEYKQWQIDDMADDVEKLIEKNGRKKTDQELKDASWYDPEWYEKYPEDLYHHRYPDEVIEKFKEGLNYLRIAAIYAQRIDWLVSGDDGEDSFLKRLKNDLHKLKNKSTPDEV
jgi:hypothetical protein